MQLCKQGHCCLSVDCVNLLASDVENGLCVQYENAGDQYLGQVLVRGLDINDVSFTALPEKRCLNS